MATGPADPDGSIPRRVFGGQYRATRLLKRSGAGETLLGMDLRQGDPVIIKTVAATSLTPIARMRMEHEAEILRQLAGACFPMLIEFGREEDLSWVVTAFVPGHTLQEQMTYGPLTVAETLTLGRSVLADLRQAHQLGVLHRDVRPSNIIVDEHRPLRLATLIDFGQPRSAMIEGSIRDRPLSAAMYLSPESAGLIDQDVAESSDLHSLGLVLYTCLAGRPPFPGPSVGELLRQKMTLQPPELRGLGVAVPRALDELIARLLRKDPRDRYQTAAAALADVEAVATSLTLGVVEPDLVVGLHDRRRTLTEPAFVGRASDLQSLEAHLDTVRAGRRVLVYLEAESGGGKTRLLDEIARRALHRGERVLRGQGQDQVAQRPYQLLAPVIGDIVAAARESPGLAGRLRTDLAEQREAACAVLPELTALFDWSDTRAAGPEAFAEARTLQALTAVLEALGESDRPTLVLLDDFQWADQLTVKLIGHWWRRREARPSPVLVIAAFRTEEVSADHPLRMLQPQETLALPPFSGDDVRRLLQSMAGPLPDEALEVVLQLSGGSPFMASAVLRGLVESGALEAGVDGWHVERRAMADLRSSQHAGVFLARRLQLLPPAGMRLLAIGALLGKEFDGEMAANLAEQSASQAIVALEEARRRHLVWLGSRQGQCVFVHDKLRETLLASLSVGDRSALHGRAARYLESLGGKRPFDLAYHFDAAGESARALPHALLAAEQARAQHSLDISEQLYRIAERGVSAEDRPTRLRISLGLGDVLMLLGRYDDAVRQTEAARDLAADHVARANIEGKLGELAFKRGDTLTAMVALERALASLGQGPPTTAGGFLLRVIGETCVQALHTLLPRLVVGRRKLDDAAEPLLVVRLLNRLSYAYWFKRGQIPCLWSHLRAMNLAERYPPTSELAQAYSIHAPVMTLVPYLSRGARYAQRSFDIYQSLGDVWGQGQSNSFHGMTYYVGGRYDQGLERFREAVRLLERTGDYWEMNIARYHIANSLYRTGDLARAVAEARRIHRSGLELGDTQATGICLDAWARASGGEIDEEIVQVELQRPREDVQVSAQVMLAEGVRLLGLERLEEAGALFEKAWNFAKRAGVVNAWVVPLHAWLATALRRQVEVTSSLAPGRRTALLARAHRAARKAVRVGRTFQNDLPHALREAGLVAAMEGKLRRARLDLDESLTIADRQGARFEHAQTLLARGRVGALAGWPDANDDTTAAKVALLGMGAAFATGEARSTAKADRLPTLSLADRFDNVLESGRRIAAALTRDSIFNEVREAAMRLLRSERFRLLPADDLVIPAREPEIEHARALAARVRATGVAVVHSEDQPGGESETALLAGARSALCAPIFARDMLVACFYVDHRQVVGLFGEDELRLAGFIATIAGAALENAEGFEALRRLNETLEERIRARTVDLETANADLARSNTDLEQFAYVASHDLNEPLRMVSSFTALLAREYGPQLDDEARRYIGFAVDGAQRMQSLIRDLLDFSRVGARGGSVPNVSCDEVLDDVLRDLGPAIARENAEVARSSLPVSDLDPTLLRQVLVNLVGNAIKYHRPDASPRVQVSATSLGDAWRFSVSDNGIGIEPEFREQVFLIFRRLHRRDDVEGTGIGLAIVKKIVDRQGGRVWIESAPGGGTTVCFTWPKGRASSD